MIGESVGNVAAEAFSTGDYITVALTGHAGMWQYHVARGLIVDPIAGLEGLAAFDVAEARFYRTVLAWMLGDEDQACRGLERLNTPEAEALLALIRKPHIRVLSQVPRFGGGAFTLLEGIADDPKFLIFEIGSRASDLPSMRSLGRSGLLERNGAPDFYVCAMLEWEHPPVDLGVLRCPTIGYTSDFDAQILSVAPWLKALDHVMVCDHLVEWRDVCAIKGSRVYAFPLVFAAPRGLPPLGDGPRDIDVFFSGTLLSSYQPDKAKLINQLLRIPDIELLLVDGHVSWDEYYRLLARSKITQSFCRHPGAMLTRAIESLSMGSIALVQEGSVHTLWGGDDAGLFTFDGVRGPEPQIQRILADYQRYGDACRNNAAVIRRAFSAETIASRFFRFCTFLAAQPRGPRQPKDHAALNQKRHAFLFGFRPSLSEAASHCRGLLASGQLDRQPELEASNLRAREIALLHCQALHIGEHLVGEDLGLDRGLAELEQTIARHPDALIARFNLMRLLLHLGTEEQVQRGLLLGRDLVDSPPEAWRLDGRQDVYPWDLFPEWFNCRAYFDVVIEGLAGRHSPERRLRDLILASVHHYLAVYETSVEHSEAACRLDPTFPYYRLSLARLLLRSGASADGRRVHALLVELVEGSVVAGQAFRELQALAEWHGPSAAAVAELQPVFARAHSSLLSPRPELLTLRSEFMRRRRIRGQEGYGSLVHKSGQASRFVRLSVVVCGQAGAGCEVVLRGLDGQDVPRELFEVIYVECFGNVAADAVALADVVLSCGQDSFLEHRPLALSFALQAAHADVIVVVEPGSRLPADFVATLLATYYAASDPLDGECDSVPAVCVLLSGWFDDDSGAPRFAAFPRSQARLVGGFDLHTVFSGELGTPLELAWRLQQFGVPVIVSGPDGRVLKRLPPWWLLPPFENRQPLLLVCSELWPLLLDEKRVDPLVSWRQAFALRPADNPEKVGEDFYDFNIIRYQGHYIAVRQSLGALDFQIGLASLTTQLGAENAILGEEIGPLREDIIALSASRPTLTAASDIDHGPELVDSLHQFNVVCYKGQYVGLRQSIGQVDIREGVGILLGKFGSENVLVGDSLDSLRRRIIAVAGEYA